MGINMNTSYKLITKNKYDALIHKSVDMKNNIRIEEMKFILSSEDLQMIYLGHFLFVYFDIWTMDLIYSDIYDQ